MKIHLFLPSLSSVGVPGAAFFCSVIRSAGFYNFKSKIIQIASFRRGALHQRARELEFGLFTRAAGETHHGAQAAGPSA